MAELLDEEMVGGHLARRERPQRDARNAAGRTGLAHQNRIKPAATPLAPGHGAKLMAPLAQTLAIGVFQLGRERAFTHPRRIGLDDAHDAFERLGGEAGTGAGPAGRGIGGGDKGIGAVIDIQQRALCAFEENGFAGLPCLV